MTSRVLELEKTPDSNGRCIVYVMSRDQRVNDNHALLEAQAEALQNKLPLIVLFNVLPSTGYRKREHYEFMLQGLQEVKSELIKKNIAFVMTIGNAYENASRLMDELTPRSLYFDFSPLRGPRSVQKRIAAAARCRVAVVDTHNVVPTWVLSDKEEFAAHTIRRKIHRSIDAWAKEPEELKKHPYSLESVPHSVSDKDVDELLLSIPKSGIEHGFTAGESAARQSLRRFIDSGINNYAGNRNDPTLPGQSDLSPYLHYGQISSLRILLEVMESTSHPPQIFTSLKMPSYEGVPTKSDGIDSFVEELIVRKELSDNFCFYNTNYDKLDGAKDWAKKTLQEHANDPREHTYSKKQLETAQTHDDIWNAAQLQLITSGKIHGYMRMYWAKKILEWTDSPEIAIGWAIELNDSYHLDGGDPNGYVGVLWSMAGVHDRPWFNRSVYGTIRYMNASGLKKKFDTEAYVKHWTNKS